MADSQSTPSAKMPDFVQKALTRVDVGKLRMDKRVLWGGAAVLVAVIAGWFLIGARQDSEPYRTSPADRGEITRVVSATGALKPLVSVDVGSTVSGPVKTVEVDFNSNVRQGQVLARLDPESFEQRVQQAQATLRQAQATLAVAESDYNRYARLAQEGFASAQLMSQQRATRDRARADVSQASAALASSRTDLDRSVIRSPIDGVVVNRQVNPGQSVAASFQAPVLFVIAQDLQRLQAEITVDEADIGEVREGMPVRFTVDAFPDEEFEGTLSQVRQQGVDTNGVVSYTVVVQADNPGRRLKPGMTANAEIIVEQINEAMRIPNAALRFRPADEALAARGQALLAGGRQGGQGASANASAGGGEQRGRGGQGGQGRGFNRMFEELNLTEAQQEQARAITQNAMASAGERPGQDASEADRRAFMRRVRENAMRQIEPILTQEQRTKLQEIRERGPQTGQRRAQTRAVVIWVLRDNRPTPVRVNVGVSDDSFTAVMGGDLREGDQVITGGGPEATNNQRQQQGNPMGGGGPMGGGARIRGV
ncbi:MAG: efflux RND transporter periplasmic adaptor subunit [Caulobacterales bacterium]